jgi:hypothetical protein
VSRPKQVGVALPHLVNLGACAPRLIRTEGTRKIRRGTAPVSGCDQPTRAEIVRQRLLLKIAGGHRIADGFLVDRKELRGLRPPNDGLLRSHEQRETLEVVGTVSGELTERLRSGGYAGGGLLALADTRARISGRQHESAPEVLDDRPDRPGNRDLACAVHGFEAGSRFVENHAQMKLRAAQNRDEERRRPRVAGDDFLFVQMFVRE